MGDGNPFRPAARWQSQLRRMPDKRLIWPAVRTTESRVSIHPRNKTRRNNTPAPLNRGNASAANPAATDDQIILVKNAGLPRCNRPLRQAERDPGAAFGIRSHQRRCSWVGVADFSGHFERPVWMVEGNPIASFNLEFASIKVAFAADNHAIIRGIQFDDI